MEVERVTKKVRIACKTGECFGTAELVGRKEQTVVVHEMEKDGGGKMCGGGNEGPRNTWMA